MAGKRGNNEGNIRQRADGLWEARLSLEGGKRKSFYGKTRADVARQLAAAIRDRDAGLPVAGGGRLTVAQFLDGWLERVKSSLKPRTHTRYAELARHVSESVGTLPLVRLTPARIEHLYADKIAEGLSTSTAHHIHAVLHKALGDAYRKGLLAHNPCDRVDAPRMAKYRGAVLTAEQSRAVLDTAADDRLCALYTLALTTGARLGELLALRWKDIDLDDKVLRINGTMQYIGGALSIQTPKTEGSRRAIALTSLGVDALRAHRKRQAEERLAIGPDWEDGDLVFCTPIGGPIDGRTLLRSDFYPLLARAGVPRVRFHDLRHSAATFLVSLGVPMAVVAQILGHSSIRVTGDTYSHVSVAMQRQAMNDLDALLRKRQA